MTRGQRRVFDEEFKRAAVAKVAAGRTAMSVATEIVAAADLLYRWKKDLAAAEAAGQKSVNELEAELRAMRRRAERAEMEEEILKKPFRSSAPPPESTEIHVHQ